MGLETGTRLGPYEITGSLGAGGMGEVYHARDTKLGRSVALKILPDVFAGDPERVARFDREARTLASLNHPHIAHIYGFEQSAGSSALVMELVEGEDLSQRLARGPIPLDEALAIATQVAQALEAAHDQGIIHRDLKPANIKLRPDGTVKVLDFGLAKALDQGSGPTGRGGDHLLNSPTITSPAAMTVGGVVLGTAAYMSPEQARGRMVDRRADIWAFGVLLYEMLTGRQLFGGETVSDTIAAVLTRQPAFDALPSSTPPGVRRVLERCLQKDPGRRFHHIADARIELEPPGAVPLAPVMMPEFTRASPPRLRWVPSLALAVASAGLATLLVWLVMSRSALPARPYSFTIPGAGFSTVSYSAISPDGKWIAYAPNVNAAPFRFFLRPLDGFEAREVVAPSSTGLNPFFSPDSRSLAFFMENALYKVPVSGGVPERVAPLIPGAADGAWADNGTIVVSANFRVDNIVRRPLARVSSQGRAFENLTRPGPSESHHDPHVLPGSRTVLFTLATPQSSAIAAVPLAGGPHRIILPDARRPRYSVSGHLVFQRRSSGDLMSIAFDPSGLGISGEPTRIAAVAPIVDTAAFDLSQDGTLIYSAPTETAEQSGFTAVAVDRSGAETTLLAQTGSWAEPRISPDGRTLLLRDIASPDCILWTLDLARGTKTRVTFEGDSHNPVWRADGRLTWGGRAQGVRGIRMARADRPSQVTALADAANERVPESWSPDGKRLAFTETHPTTGQDIWLLSVDSGAARPFIAAAFKENQARFSPDGQWIAYVSNESGRDEVYVQPADGDGGRLQISSNGGNSPLWSPDGRELFYGEHVQLMVVAIDLRRSPADISRPRKLLGGPYVWERPANFDITPDGRRFVFVRRGEGADPSATLRVLLNWAAPPQKGVR